MSISKAELETLKAPCHRVSRGFAKAREGYYEALRAESDVEVLLDKLFYGNDNGIASHFNRTGRVRRKVFGKAVFLTNKLASIFDAFVEACDWLKADQSLAILWKQTGRTPSRRALCQALYRLNREFELRDIGRGAIQSSESTGYRLRPSARRDNS
jgi:hypothetical protein